MNAGKIVLVWYWFSRDAGFTLRIQQTWGKLWARQRWACQHSEVYLILLHQKIKPTQPLRVQELTSTAAAVRAGLLPHRSQIFVCDRRGNLLAMTTRKRRKRQLPRVPVPEGRAESFITRSRYTRHDMSARRSMKSKSWLMSYVIDGLLGFCCFKCSSNILQMPEKKSGSFVEVLLRLGNASHRH